MANQTVQTLKKTIKKMGMTYEQLSINSGIPLNTLKNIFSGRTENPRIDTMQAIERALGLAPTFTEEERALGLSENYAVVLSDIDRHDFHILARAREKLGDEYVNAHMKLLELATENKDKK